MRARICPSRDHQIRLLALKHTGQSLLEKEKKNQCVRPNPPSDYRNSDRDWRFPCWLALLTRTMSLSASMS